MLKFNLFGETNPPSPEPPGNLGTARLGQSVLPLNQAEILTQIEETARLGHCPDGLAWQRFIDAHDLLVTDQQRRSEFYVARDTHLRVIAARWPVPEAEPEKQRVRIFDPPSTIQRRARPTR